MVLGCISCCRWVCCWVYLILMLVFSWAFRFRFLEFCLLLVSGILLLFVISGLVLDECSLLVLR